MMRLLENLQQTAQQFLPYAVKMVADALSRSAHHRPRGPPFSCARPLYAGLPRNRPVQTFFGLAMNARSSRTARIP
jgi:hypothetical protein